MNCDNQKEVDRMWEKLSQGGSEVQCGWLKDKFGMSWQIVPAIVGRMISHPDPTRAARVMQAVMRMKKLDIKELKKAFG